MVLSFLSWAWQVGLGELHKIRAQKCGQESGIFGEKGTGIARAECYNRSADSAAQ